MAKYPQIFWGLTRSCMLHQRMLLANFSEIFPRTLAANCARLREPCASFRLAASCRWPK